MNFPDRVFDMSITIMAHDLEVSTEPSSRFFLADDKEAIGLLSRS